MAMYLGLSRLNVGRAYVIGTCLMNPRYGGQPSAGAGVWFADNHPWNVSSIVPGDQNVDNAHLYAAIVALEVLLINNVYDVELVTDSINLFNLLIFWDNKILDHWCNYGEIPVVNCVMIQRLIYNLRTFNSLSLELVATESNDYGKKEAYYLADLGAIYNGTHLQPNNVYYY